MSLIISHTEKTFQPIEQGNHVARCVQLIDLGTQTETKFDSEEQVQAHKIRITWELPNEIIEWEDKNTKERKSGPRVISREFKVSLHEKAALRQLLASWRGRDFTQDELRSFDLRNILDKPCMLNITHTEKNGNTYANIAAVTPLAKGMICPDRITNVVEYDIADGYNNAYHILPEFIKKKILGSVEMSSSQRAEDNLPDVDIDTAITDDCAPLIEGRPAHTEV